MLKIGITGGIGSGKTTICKVFETLGIPIFYADTVAKQIMTTDQILMDGVRATFGEESYLEGNILNNKHIANIVFNNEKELIKLNALVHPAVFRAFDEWDAKLPKHLPYSIKEAALLFESGSYEMCDKNILVTSPHALKIERVTKRDKVSEEQVLARMGKQFTDKQKLKLADYLIENNESKSIILQVLDLHQQFLIMK
ncbi:MAG: dephospho-CoA kinase [Pedobacter sp.]|uniref:dephospho-CoA kinase n=1 Tax=Pedobacter sp. TaxID=1411316 RepID=UPI002808B3DE|nr:dephospho-CoA kinase [Pedobacter sp.]MDQ8005159.1 dephospho-CoA kinase [Pedobacter sp.]